MKKLIVIAGMFLASLSIAGVPPYAYKVIILDPYHYAISLHNNTQYPAECTLFISDGRWQRIKVDSAALKKDPPVAYIGHNTLVFSLQCTPKLPERPI